MGKHVGNLVKGSFDQLQTACVADMAGGNIGRIVPACLSLGGGKIALGVVGHLKQEGLLGGTACADEISEVEEDIAALGQPHFLKADMVKEGAVVIDVGTTRVPDATRKSGFRLCGDVDYENVAPKCSYITPVPGGVGPMTIVSLMKNTLLAGKREIYK